LLAETAQNIQEGVAKPEEKKIPPAPFLSLFTYTTAPEKLILIVGTISSIIAGAVFPYFLIFFADITSIFD